MQHKPPQSIDRPAQRPALRAGVPVIWCDATTLRIGTSSAVTLSYDSPAHALLVAKFLADLDGSRAWSELLEQDALLLHLAEHGVLDDAACAAIPSTEHSRERATSELAALGLIPNSPTHHHDVLLNRSRTTISVRGDGRLGAAIATLLAASGIGRILIAPEPGGNGRGVVTDYDTGSILRHNDVGLNRVGAVRAAVERASLSVGERNDTALAIIARDCPTSSPWIDPQSCTDLVSAQRPHLLAAVAGTVGRIGPFVTDGSPCQLCFALHLTDADPAWPMVAAHLIRPRRTIAPPVAAIAVAQTAAMTAQTALAFIDQGITPEGVVDLDGWDITSSPLTAHPRCGCSCRLSDLQVA